MTVSHLTKVIPFYRDLCGGREVWLVSVPFTVPYVPYIKILCCNFLYRLYTFNVDTKSIIIFFPILNPCIKSLLCLLEKLKSMSFFMIKIFIGNKIWIKSSSKTICITSIKSTGVQVWFTYFTNCFWFENYKTYRNKTRTDYYRKSKESPCKTLLRKIYLFVDPSFPLCNSVLTFTTTPDSQTQEGFQTHNFRTKGSYYYNTPPRKSSINSVLPSPEYLP